MVSIMIDEDLHNLRVLLEKHRGHKFVIKPPMQAENAFVCDGQELLIVIREAIAWRAAIRSASKIPFEETVASPAALRLLIEPTPIISITGRPVEVRLWKGLTSRGTEVSAFILAIGSQSPDFDAESAGLKPTEPPPIAELPPL
jgi:hypothetical protein